MNNFIVRRNTAMYFFLEGMRFFIKNMSEEGKAVSAMIFGKRCFESHFYYIFLKVYIVNSYQ